MDLPQRNPDAAGFYPPLIDMPLSVRIGNASMPIFLILVVTYLFVGLVGHDPWKQDETYIFGIVQHMLESGDWVVPVVAGEPFMEKPPLYYWVATAFVRLFSEHLPMHDGARLATGFFMAIACIATGWNARRIWGIGVGRVAVLALLGCLGIVFYGHLMLTDVPLLTGFAIALCGFTMARSDRWAAGLLLSVGVGMGFLAKGVLAPAVIGLTAILLPICFRQWRERIYLHSLVIASIAVLPWLLIWPIALYLRSPALFVEWFWINNIGRFIGFSVPLLGAPHEPGFWAETMPWFTFPALPLAIAAIWQKRKTALVNESIQCLSMLFAVMLAVLAVSASARPNYALPLLPPLCLLAAPAAINLTDKIDRLFDWCARILFGVFAIFIWSIWMWMVVRGAPPAWSLLGHYLPMDFNLAVNQNDVSLALILTLSAGALIWNMPPMRGRGILSWVVGLALCWSLVMTLWLPWIDYAKSYRSVFQSMQRELPPSHRCIASSGLGESERAMLHYVLGINTERREIRSDPACDLLLIDGTRAAPPDNIDWEHWSLVWEGARPGDLRERFWLFKQNENPSMLISSSGPH